MFIEAKQYPYIKWEGNPDKKPDNYYNFTEVLVPGNSYLKSLGGDYDGQKADLFLRKISKI